jgi:hypothetical protein
MPLALPLLQQLQCRASGFVQSGHKMSVGWVKIRNSKLGVKIPCFRAEFSLPCSVA